MTYRDTLSVVANAIAGQLAFTGADPEMVVGADVDVRWYGNGAAFVEASLQFLESTISMDDLERGGNWWLSIQPPLW